MMYFSCNQYENYTIYLKADDVTGLNLNSMIFLKGMEIGYVSNIDLNANNKVIVTLKIKRDYKIRKNACIISKTINFMGDKALFIEDNNKESYYASNNDTLYLDLKEYKIDYTILYKMDSLLNVKMNE